MEHHHLQTIIIGSGVGGCFTSKELHERGSNFLCFDALPRPGGVYVRYGYDHMHFTTSTQTAAFGDFPWTGPPAHWSIPEFLEYLDAYIAHFGFGHRLRMNSRVETVKRLVANGPSWEVTVRQGGGHRHGDGCTTPKPAVDRYTCDNLVIATGTHNAWEYPDIPGLKTRYRGKFYHSSMFHDIAKRGELRGKHVLIMGLGESGADLCKFAADAARKVTVLVPHHSAVYFHREFEGAPADTVDSRAMYCLPRGMAHPVLRHTLRRRFLKHSYDQDLFSAAAEANFKSGRTPFNSFGVKSLDLFEALVRRRQVEAVEARAAHFEHDDVVLSNGCRVCPDVVLFSTGYRLRFPFFEKTEPELANRLQHIRSLWKHCVVPELDSALFCVGFARPNMTSLFIPTELQARLVAAVVTGALALPAAVTMRAEATEDAAYYNHVFPGCSRVGALVDHLHYNDGLAEFLGASPPLLRALLEGDLRLFVHLFFGSLNASHYRFSGPGPALKDGKVRTARGRQYAEAAMAVKRIPLHLNYRRALLQPHFILMNFAMPVMLFASPFAASVEPVGIMRYAVKVFWGFFFLVLAALLLLSEGAEQQTILRLLFQALRISLATYYVLGNSLIALAYAFSPTPTLPGVPLTKRSTKSRNGPQVCASSYSDIKVA